MSPSSPPPQGPAGSLLPENVVLAVAQAMRVPVADRGGVFPASARAEGLLASARTAVADLVGGVPTRVVLGPDTSRLTWSVARALARTWRPGDEVVVSRLDHDANVRPWVELAARAGVAVRWAEVDIETGELPDWQYDELLGPRTRLVAVTAASSAIGTRPDVAAIARRAHAVGALGYVDGTHAAAHDLLDVRALGADFLTVAADMWCGPHVGAVVADPELLTELEPEKLLPVSDRVPDRFESGGGTVPLAPRGTPAAAGPAARLDGRGGRLRARAVRLAGPGAARDAPRAGHRLGAAQHADAVVHGRGHAPAAGGPRAVPARHLRLGRRPLGPGAVRRAGGQRGGRRRPAGADALQHGRGGRVPRRRGRRAAPSLRKGPGITRRRSAAGPSRRARWRRPRGAPRRPGTWA